MCWSVHLIVRCHSEPQAVNKGSLRSPVLLSVQRALVGEIDPYMRAVSVEWDESRIRIHVY